MTFFLFLESQWCASGVISLPLDWWHSFQIHGTILRDNCRENLLLRFLRWLYHHVEMQRKLDSIILLIFWRELAYPIHQTTPESDGKTLP